MTWKKGKTPSVISDGVTKDGTIARDRIDFLIDKKCKVRVWWNQEGQISSPEGDCFEAKVIDVFPVGRDYYFVFLTGSDENPKRSIIKTAAVLQITEL